MSRAYLKLGVTLIILLSVGTLLIRARPYDDHDLRALLMPSNCAMPCFMDIRPGLTTVDEAIHILQTSQWVDAASVHAVREQVSWMWSEDASVLFDKRVYSHQAYFIFANQVVETVFIATRVRLGEVVLLWGDPVVYDSVSLPNPDDAPNSKKIFSVYRDRKVTLQGYVECPYFINVWNTEIRVEMGRRSSATRYNVEAFGWPSEYATSFNTRQFFMDQRDHCR